MHRKKKKNKKKGDLFTIFLSTFKQTWSYLKVSYHIHHLRHRLSLLISVNYKMQFKLSMRINISTLVFSTISTKRHPLM